MAITTATTTTTTSEAPALRLGSLAPEFQGQTSLGPLPSFHAWKAGSWAILFSHPDDYTPVCTTELGQVAALHQEWSRRGVKVMGLSCNTTDQHAGWIEDINATQNCTVNFPIIADADRSIATLYGMLDAQDPTNVMPTGLPLTVRSVFILDPSHVIRAMIIYPASTGRNFVEILRLVDSLQLTSRERVATPVNWTPGQDTIIPPSVSEEQAVKYPGYRKVLPYLRYCTDPSTLSK